MQVEQVYSLLFLAFVMILQSFALILAYSVMKIPQIGKKPFLVLRTLVRHYLQLVINKSEPMKHWNGDLMTCIPETDVM